VHKGKPPKQPLATLPPGAPRPEPNADARHKIAGGPTDDEKTAPLDAELQVLRDAERVLFPRALPGVRSGWSWDFEHSTSEIPGSLILPPDSPVPDPRVRQEPVGKWLAELALPNIPTRFEANVVTYLQFYRSTAQGKTLLRTWAKRSGRYSKLIATEFAKAGLPTDLVWQSMIESGHNALAKSGAGAVGLWQFLPETARAYGLVVDRWVDERLDPQRSTEASAKLLADLHRRFGNWELALAAYNMGHAGLSRAIRKYNTNDYWLLCQYEGGLPWETTLYVPKIEALAIAMANRSVFGINDVEPESGPGVDVVSVGPGLPLSTIAKAAGLTENEIVQLNPQFLAGRTPPAAPGQSRATNYAIRVPIGTGAILARKLSSLTAPDVTLEVYVIKQGDTLESVARAANVLVPDLRNINQVGSAEILVAGDLLLLPRRDRPLDVDIAEDEKVVVVPRESKPPPGMRRLFYRVVPGDTLSSIAKAFQVRRSDLLDWNSIDTTARLQPKMALAVYVPERQELSGVRYVVESEVRVLIAGSREFAEYFEAMRGNERIVVQAHAGDTLASIAAKYHLNAATLERVNRRSRTARYADGEEVVLYALRGKVAKPAHQATREQRDAEGTVKPVDLKKKSETAGPALPDSS
jgi:membrane-bound lytic murein transglycosylase D